MYAALFELTSENYYFFFCQGIWMFSYSIKKIVKFTMFLVSAMFSGNEEPKEGN